MYSESEVTVTDKRVIRTFKHKATIDIPIEKITYIEPFQQAGIHFYVGDKKIDIDYVKNDYDIYKEIKILFEKEKKKEICITNKKYRAL